MSEPLESLQVVEVKVKVQPSATLGEVQQAVIRIFRGVATERDRKLFTGAVIHTKVQPMGTVEALGPSKGFLFDEEVEVK